MKVADVMKSALELGACNQSGKATDWKSLCWLFFTPQGREFCEENNFPSLDIFRSMKRHVSSYGVYVDAGDVSFKNNANIGIIGGTNATLVGVKFSMFTGLMPFIESSNFSTAARLSLVTIGHPTMLSTTRFLASSVRFCAYVAAMSAVLAAG